MLQQRGVFVNLSDDSKMYNHSLLVTSAVVMKMKNKYHDGRSGFNAAARHK